ncbi:MAG: leucine--tRNA ligase [archaeon]
MVEFNFAKIEKKWQKKWEDGKIFEVNKNSKKPKYYILEMFPYPSSSGLHMGHALNYSIGDILARFKRMNNFEVLYPMGFDAFGLPAENAAIKAGEHPRPFTENAMKNYVRQMKELGLSYDWTKTLATMYPEYYKWNQFFFLKFLEAGLIYRKKAPVNWCPSCNTVISNEQAQGGICERCKSKIEIRRLDEWCLKTTNYADELIEGLEELDWPEKIKAMQRNWIGKSHGTEIDFLVEGENKISNVVIVHGCPSNKEKALSPETRTYDKHWIPWTKKKLSDKGIKVETPMMPEPWMANYNDWKKKFEKLNIDENSILIGHSCGCAFLVRWLGDTKQKVKKLILVAPWKIDSKNRKNGFYTYDIDEEIKNRVGKITMFTSNDEEEDGKKSVKIFNEAIGGKVIELSERGHYTMGDMKTEKFSELLEEIIDNKTTWPIFTTRPDTIFGVTFMVVSAQHQRLNELVTEEQKEKVDKFLKSLGSVSEKEIESLEKEGIFTGSYAINPVNGESIPIYAGNFVVADYGAGMVMAVPAHDQRDFEFAKKYGIEIKQVISGKLTDTRAWTDEGKLINSDKFNNLNNIEAKEKITDWLIEKNVARKVVNYKLRDWGFSRQRYWGTPIPIIYCPKCGAVPVPEKDLPVILPDDVKFGKGNPLETNEEWVNVKCPECGGAGKRETETMDTFFDSSWYFLRYPDNKNNKEPFDKKKIKKRLPVDQYIGGAEHACMHLIYARFFTKALRDLGFLDFDEPFKALFNQGMLSGTDGDKMSKSKGNVINPDEISSKYGMDTARYFLLSLAAPDKPRDWSEKGVRGSLRFIKKIFDTSENIKFGKSSDEFISKLNSTIKDVSEFYSSFQYRKATIELKELFDLLAEQKEVAKKDMENSLKLLSPICPHITEELWEKLGNKDFISISEWPKADEKKIQKKEQVADLNEKIINELKPIVEKYPDKKNVYLYVMPFEIGKIDVSKISDAIGKDVNIFAVDDSKKYDPENKAKKAKPGKAGIYLE